MTTKTDNPRFVSDLFNRIATVYDTAALQRVVYQPAQDRVVHELARRRPRRVLDVGCGTGILTARIYRELRPEVTYGCDPSTGMLAKARARVGAVQWLEGVAESLPLPSRSVDAVVSTTAFHFFDQPAALREFYRVLTPGGAVIVAAATTLTDVGAAAVAPLAELAGTGFVPSRRALREMFADAGFGAITQARPRRLVLRGLDPMVVTIATKP